MHIVERTVLLESTPGASCELSSARPQGSRTHAARGAGEAPEGGLGNNAIFPARHFTAVDQETGEIRRIEFRPDGKPVLARPTPMERRALMYVRKTGVDELLQLLPKRPNGQPHRTFKCYRVPLPSGQAAAMYSTEFARAFYAGLQVCANPWLCPICMRKLSERKKVEVEAGITLAKAMGRRAVLLTLTFRHDNGDRLEDLLPRLLKAYEAGFSKNKSARLFKQALGILGSIKALEITWSRDNGFHPHLHVLLIVDASAPHVDQIQHLASAIWTKACEKVGRYAHPDIGANAQEGDNAGGYVTKMGLDESKWTLASEMTKGGSKNGRATGLSMLQLVDLAMDDDKAAIAAWVQYAKATEGKHPLRWSNGLRKALGMNAARTDEELAAETEDETAVLFSLITKAGWKRIHARRLKAYLLDLIETDPDQARAFITEIELEASRVTSPVTF